MPDFLYKARDRDGNLVQGTMGAEDKGEIIDILQRRNLLITSVDEILVRKKATFSLGKTTKGPRLSRSVKGEDLCLFARQMGTLLNAGVPLLRSLTVLGKQVGSRPLRDAIDEIKDDIQGGSTLKAAIEKHPKVFSSFWVNLIGTGEASGQLPSVLEQIAQYFESSGELQRKVISALMYPGILMTVCTGSIIIFVVKIIPVFAEMFESFGTELPPVTQFVVNLSYIFRKFGLGIAIGLPFLVMGFLKIIKTDKGRLHFDRFRLALPVFGDLFRNIAITNFTRGLGTMIASGVPILYALEIVTKTVGNKVMEISLETVKDSVRDGKTIADPLERTGLFPPMVVLMVNVGEETGELADMLTHVSKFYEERVTMMVERLSSLLEPFMLVFMGFLVGFLVIAMFMPIFKIATSVNI